MQTGQLRTALAVLLAGLVVVACGAPAAPRASAPAAGESAAPGQASAGAANAAQASGSPASGGSAAGAARSEPAVGAHAPEVQRLIEGARREGELNLVLSSSYFNEGKALPEIEQAFNAHFGLTTRINRVAGPSMPQTAARVAQEVQAGRAPQTDLYHGSDEHIATLLAAGALQPIEWRALDSRIPANAVAEGSVAVAYGSWFPGITYNENLVSAADAPKSLADVLQPRWQGKIASTPYAAGFYRLALSNEWGEQRTTEYVRQLADQVGGLLRCGEHERLLSGEFQMLVLNCGVHVDQRAQRDGQPLNFVVPADAVRVSYYSVGVPKGSAHPNTATLFALFLLSEPGQRLSYASDLLDLHLLPGSQSVALVKPLLDQGGRLLGEDGMVQMSKYAIESSVYEKEYARLIAKQ
jgi:iron(III) transport system substrate-binding protein